MEPSKEAIAVRLTRLNRQILGKITNNCNSYSKKVVDRETLFDALTVLYDECNEDCVKKGDEHIRGFLDKYRSALAELRRARVCISDFEMLQMIGKGHFGVVHMVREKQTGDVYALKTLRKESALTRKGVACYEEERDVLAAGAEPWLIKLQYAFQDSNNLYLVMELCCGGDLAGLLLRRSHPLSEQDAAFYVAEVAHALRALHALGYVHRDVKPHNILLDRCGHVKLCDFGSAIRLSEGGTATIPVGTPDYVAPELLSAATCTHAVCLQYCRALLTASVAACDYWSLGVVAFELVTLRTPFTVNQEESLAHTLSNIQSYERQDNPEPPFDPLPASPSAEWRSLVSGLLRVQPGKRYHYLDTLQHPALKHLSPHSIRDQVPPWVPCVRGPEDASHFARVQREMRPPDALPFRTRAPFAGQVPFIGYSFVASEGGEEHSTTTFTSHDCTAIDLATYKSAEKLAAVRGREVARLQTLLEAAESAAGEGEQAARAQAEADAGVQRQAMQRELAQYTASLKRVERELDAEKEERRIIERAHNELLSSTKERTSTELKAMYAKTEHLDTERNILKEEVAKLESRVMELESDCQKAAAVAETTRIQQTHYKDILSQVHELRHRRLTEINVRPIDTIAKERALRRQTLTDTSVETREAVIKLAAAESNAMRETRARREAEKKVAELEHQNNTLRTQLAEMKTQLEKAQESNVLGVHNVEKQSTELKKVKAQLTQEQSKHNTLNLQLMELQQTLDEVNSREVALVEQHNRTKNRLQERLNVAENRVTEAHASEARHREKVHTLERLVRELERQVSALEASGLAIEKNRDVAMSDTESVNGMESHEHEAAALAQVSLLKEQLEKTEAQIQARAEEMAALRQEARAANLSKWRKERDVSELTTENKTLTREVKRLEERLAASLAARKSAEEKLASTQSELITLRPEVEKIRLELDTIKKQYDAKLKLNENLDDEVSRSRNDILRLKSELQYSEKRRLHAESQEEMGSRERVVLRDEAAELRVVNNQLSQNNKALQEACTLLEDQLTDLEKLTDLNEIKNKDLEHEISRLREEVTSCRARLIEAERSASDGRATAASVARQHEEAREAANHAHCQLNLLQERLESREARVAELESQLSSCESARASAEAAVCSAATRVRSLQEECAQLRTRAHQHHSLVLQLQAKLADAQEEIAAAREAADAASSWWRTRETKADATLRQQAKLIDFLQAKVEDANRKKGSLNKLFGSKGRRLAASPPLRKANRDLREEVERLRARLAAVDLHYEPTPKKEKTIRPRNSVLSIDVPDGQKEKILELLWNDGKRECVTVRIDIGTLLLTRARSSGPLRATLFHNTPAHADTLTQEEAQRAFSIKIDGLENGKSSHVTAICNSAEDRSMYLRTLVVPRTIVYTPLQIASVKSAATTALYLHEDAVAIGCLDGLQSLHGLVRLECEEDECPAGAVSSVCCVVGRVLVVRAGLLYHAATHATASALRRASSLQPALRVRRAHTGLVNMLQVLSGQSGDGPCAVASCGRRVYLLYYDAAASDIRVARSFTIDRPPSAMLLTANHLFIAGEKLLRVSLPSGALESFGTSEPTILAAARKHSPPRAILLIRENPIEILVCYNECGIFVDEKGKRSRSEDARWTSTIYSWCFVNPFLYCIGKDNIIISYINEESYVPPPCTCDNHSVASTNSDCAMPKYHIIQVKEATLLGSTPNGILVRSPLDNGFSVLLVNGLKALRSIGSSVESLASVNECRESLNSSMASQNIEPDTESKEEDMCTGFLADIRKRANQLRNRQKKENPDDVIKEILAAEVGPRSAVLGRRSPATVSEFSTDSESDGRESTPTPADICADMFSKQVRFQS